MKKDTVLTGSFDWNDKFISIPKRIILMRIIPRRIEMEEIEKSKPWVMVYGRRKTGKTFLVENFIPHDRFFFVNRDGTVLDKNSGEFYIYSEFLKIFREIIGDKTVVIDEFHRLPESFPDYLHALGVKGNLILITSTLHLAKRLLGKGKPLLGLVRPVRVGLIDEREIVAEISKTLKGKELVETAVYLREVMLLPSYKRNIRNFLTDFLFEGKILLKELVGEIFTEEEKELTKIYEGIMKGVASGKNVSTELSTSLFSIGLLSKDNPGVLQKYLNTLVEMGILERLKVFGKKRFRYFHRSPLLDLHYYLEGKYSYSEVETPKRFIRKVVDEKIPRHVEQFFRSFLAKVFGLQCNIIEEKDLEIDIALFEFKKPKVLGEVKWKKFVSKKEIADTEAKLNRFKTPKKILIVPETDSVEREPEGIEVWDTTKVAEMAKRSLESD